MKNLVTGLVSQFQQCQEYSTCGWKSCTLDSNPASGDQTNKLFRKLCRLLTQRYCYIIDCSEIFTERPTSPQTRAKNFPITRHNTVQIFNCNYPIRKYFLRIKGVSDEELTQQGSFLDKLEPMK